MKPFVYSALPSRVIFGTDTLSQLPSEIQRLGCSKALVLTTPQQVDAGEKVVSLIGSLAVGLYTNATMHTVRLFDKPLFCLSDADFSRMHARSLRM